MNWAARRRAWPAAIGGLVLTAGLLSGSGAVAAARDVDVSLRYQCPQGGGLQVVTVRIRSSLPETAAAGKPITPGKATVTATVPAGALAELTKAGAATVAGSMSPGLLVDPSPTGRLDQPNLEIAPAPLREGEDLTVTASGALPAVTPAAGGPLVFSAGQLTVELRGRKSDGAATVPGAVSLTCTPALGQNATLGTVFVEGTERTPPSRRTTPQPGTGTRAQPPSGGATPEKPDDLGDFCPDPIDFRAPKPEYLPPNADFPDDIEYVGDRADPVNHPGWVEFMNPQGQQGCAMLYGYSNANKPGGATPVNGTAYLRPAIRFVFNGDEKINYASQYSIGKFYPQSSRASFLTYGFMPSTATMEIIPVGEVDVMGIGPFNAFLPGARTEKTVAYSKVMIRLDDVEVNGTPLDVGDNCRTARPIDLKLEGRGDTNPSYTVQGGGVMQGFIDIPEFTGCGVGEDLDPLLTSSVSGKRNYVRMVQGPLCNISGSPQYPQDEPTMPCPMQRFGWKVEQAGEFTATAADGLRLVGNQTSITCTSAVMRGSLPESSSTGSGFAEITHLVASGCTGDGELSTPFDLNFIQDWAGPAKVDLLTSSADGRWVRARMWNFQAMEDVSSTCAFDLFPYTIEGTSVGLSYDNVTGRFELNPGVLAQNNGVWLMLRWGQECGIPHANFDELKMYGTFVPDKRIKITKP
ncbi:MULTISPECIES: DUF6801 domain-containing protein [Thermomonospora]|uniref:DUF6801 domain-containing protein n=1 Tax=Thermomonospora cellulosilytica TaxID=1411118 RepID=A0A7W3R8G3_9ACTN|nr:MULTISPECIES: DUF6801 domain-containing protein [Thermomonospora]MBA9004303.1 hypothetical protein [Thermomonospora cellulosilytica]